VRSHSCALSYLFCINFSWCWSNDREKENSVQRNPPYQIAASQVAAATSGDSNVDVMETSSSSELEFRGSTTSGYGQSQYSVEADEFKLVFLNSDSSSSCKEEEEEEEEEDGNDTDTASSSSCSTHQCHSIVSNVEDCDWDYFEPSMIAATTTTTTTMIAMTPTPPPRFRRRSSDSDSPLLQRRQQLRSYCSKIRESDTGTDEELHMQAESSSQTSSDQNHTPPSCAPTVPLSMKARIKTRFLKSHHHYRIVEEQLSELSSSILWKSLKSFSGNL